ncbi:hypothetical protein [Pseudoalteromonas atlantica]|uniref:hypothetical protein n=1 Tax=Pseudoalteromonas atlantica TaxID=288 RepID=UPI000BBBDEC4|nr:hypothetical protein [Pseudoalteromonas atlantica]
MLLSKRLADLIRTCEEKIDVSLLLSSFYEGSKKVNEKHVIYENNKNFIPKNNFELSAKVFILVLYGSEENLFNEMYSFFTELNNFENKKTFLNSMIHIRKLLKGTNRSKVLTKLYSDCVNSLKAPLLKSVEKKNAALNVLIVSGYITPNKNNTHVQMLTNLSKALLTVDKRTNLNWLVTTDRTSKLIFGDFWNLNKLDKIKCFWDEELLLKDAKIHVPQQGDVDSLLDNSIEKANEINPDVIIMHGSGTESTYFCSAFKKVIPIIYYPSSVDNTPPTFVDGIFYRNSEVLGRLKGRGLRSQKLKLPYFRQNHKKIINKENNYDEKVNFCVAISRNLINEYFNSLGEEDLLKLKLLFDENEKINFIFVGACNLDGFNSEIIKELISYGRIRITGALTKENFKQVLINEVDFLFTLPGVTGGGAAIAEAIDLGKGAICSIDSDAAQSCSHEYMYKNFEGLVDMLRLLASDFSNFSRCKFLNQNMINERQSLNTFNEIYNFIFKFKGLYSD